MLTALGRFPQQPGDQVHLTDWTIEVTDTGHNVITAVCLRHTTPTATLDTTPDNDTSVSE